MIYFQKALCQLQILNSIFANNPAGMFGGAMFLQHSYGQLIFENNVFIMNSAESNSFSDSQGGAIYSLGYTTTVIYLNANQFLNNYATRGSFLRFLP